MTTMRTLIRLSLLAVVATSPVVQAAGFGDFDIDTRFRSKIVKERARQAALQADNDRKNRDSDSQFDTFGQNSSDCGSQNIGNVNTGNFPGRAPREIIVFAPNSINVVTGRGCR
jgi:hypothetical protein